MKEFNCNIGDLRVAVHELLHHVVEVPVPSNDNGWSFVEFAGVSPVAASSIAAAVRPHTLPFLSNVPFPPMIGDSNLVVHGKGLEPLTNCV